MPANKSAFSPQMFKVLTACLALTGVCGVFVRTIMAGGPGAGGQAGKVCRPAHADGSNIEQESGCTVDPGRLFPDDCVEETPASHSCSGSRWETAVPGACVDPFPARPNANCLPNNGNTLVTIKEFERGCGYGVFGMACQCEYADTGNTNQLQTTDCGGTLE